MTGLVENTQNSLITSETHCGLGFRLALGGQPSDGMRDANTGIKF